MKLHVWTNPDVALRYLSSALLVVGGLSAVLARKDWTGAWHVALTLLGWNAIVGGLAWHISFLGWPAVAGGLARFIAAPWLGGVTVTDTNSRLAEIDVLLASGLFLAFAAYRFRQRGE